jgi:hypothetical protein
MPLPLPSRPNYELVLPSTGKTIKYSPFLVKEEKILLLALQSENTREITNAIKQILKGCILTKGVKVEELPIFDIEYIFLNVRGKSVDEALDLIITCADDGETQVPYKLYIDQIEVQKNPEHSKNIDFGNGVILGMKYPSLDQFIQNNFDVKMQADISNIDKSFELISSCIEVVYNNEESWAAKDCTKKELIDFIEGLTTKQFKEIEKFFATMPILSHTITVRNPKTKEDNIIKLEGLSDFFTK